MSIRADMIGPRRLIPSGSFGRPVFALLDERQPLTEEVGQWTTKGTVNGIVPSCHQAPPPQPLQPALVIRDDLMSKAAETMFGSAESPIDVSSPHHEHARLVVKRGYLMDKLERHGRAMHPADHPEVSHRSKVLDQVERNLAYLEGQGKASRPQHNKDWIQYYKQIRMVDPEKARQLHPKEITTTLDAHEKLGKVSKSKSDEWISDKISLLVREGKPQDQAVAIAYSMAGRSKKKPADDKAEKSLRLYVSK